jgi:hypothetical protein
VSGSLQSRFKVWSATEDVVFSDLNAEFDNVLLAMQPLLVDDYSTNVTQMQIMTDAGEVGSESLATTLGGEIARLRFEIKAIKGGDVDQWYEDASTSLSDLRQLVGGSTLSTRISSGRTTGNSSQLCALIPNGSSAGLKIDGTPTNLIYYINDVQYTISTDTVTLSSLVAAPSTTNTCLVDDTNAAAGYDTLLLGEYGTVINVDTMGGNMSAMIGKVAGFKIVHSGTTEYFTAYVESTTRLRQARRGCWFDSSGNPVPRTVFSNNDTITLMKLTWIFVTSTQTMLVTYNEPVYSATQPSSPSTGDFWYDLVNQVWKRFDGTIYSASSVALLGQSLQDSANCVACRTVDSFSNQNDLNTIDLEYLGTTQVRVKNYGAQISIFGTQIRFEGYRPIWDITANLESGVTEVASKVYYFYLKEDGTQVVSDKSPTDRRGDLYGWYHPVETWRYVGKIQNGSGSDFDAQTLVVASRTKEQKYFSNDFEDVGTIKALGVAKVAPGWTIAEGSSVSRFLYDELYSSGFNAIGNNFGTADGYHFNLPKTQGYFLRGYDHAAAVDPDAVGRTALQAGGSTGDNVGSVQADQYAAHTHTWNAINGYASSGTTPTSSSGVANIVSATNGSGGNETRPKNINVQYAIKVLS